MPVHKVKGGYQWGTKGKVYPTRAGAEKQARAAYASGYKAKTSQKKKKSSSPEHPGYYSFPSVSILVCRGSTDQERQSNY